MSDKVTWLLIEYDKTHEKRGLVVSGAFSEDFVEWAINRVSKNMEAKITALVVTYSKFPSITCNEAFSRLITELRQLLVI